jgi:hypothetical protein
MYSRGKSPKPADILHQRFGISNLSKQQAAALCGVSRRTWASWEAGERRMPSATWCWFVTLTTGIPLEREWHGWRFFKGQLYSPENVGFRPGEIRAIPLLQQSLAAYRAHERRHAPSPPVAREVTEQRQFVRGQLSIAAQLLSILFNDFQHSRDPMIRELYQRTFEAGTELSRMQFKVLEAIEVTR